MRKVAAVGALSCVAFTVEAAPRGYLEGSVGIGSQEVERTESEGSALSVGVRGGVTFNQYIGVELGYQNFGKTDEQYTDSFGDDIDEQMQTTALMVGVKGILPINELFSFVGRVGFASWDFEVNGTDSSFGEFSFSDDGNDPYIGIGVNFDLKSGLVLGAELISMSAELDIGGGRTLDNDIVNVAGTVGYRF